MPKNNSEYATFRMCCTSSTFCSLCIICSWKRKVTSFFACLFCPISIISYRNRLSPSPSLSYTHTDAHACVYSPVSQHYSHLNLTQEKLKQQIAHFKKWHNFKWKAETHSYLLRIVWPASRQHITSQPLCGLWLPPSSKESQPICGLALREKEKRVEWIREGVGSWWDWLGITLA